MNASVPATVFTPVMVGVLPVEIACTIAADSMSVTTALIEQLHRAITSAAHPDCPACAALLPALAAYLRADVTPPG